MASLSDLAEYQVILFSNDIRYPMGDKDRWLKYVEGKSAKDVEKALLSKENRPQGGTNLHAPLEEAFRYRDRGLDAIYLFSDGLPNLGPPLPAAAARRIAALKKSDADAAERLKGELLGNSVREKVRESWNDPSKGKRVRIESIGFYYESPDLGSFLWSLSRENEGYFVGMSRP